MALQHAVLALLNKKTHTGYEIKEALDGPLSLMWSASFGGLYPALHRMKMKGLISENFIVQRDKPNRKEYSITSKGKQELQRWFHKPPLPENVKDEFLLKMYLMPDSDPLAVETLLAERKSYNEKRMSYFEKQSSKQPTRNLFVDYNLNRYMSELKWIMNALNIVKAKTNSK